jgi:cysteinyl-tRNA synthetase
VSIPDDVRAAAEARAAARAARDWPTADRLRGEIESAGWKVVDTGVSYRLEPSHAADVVIGDAIRYGRSDAVPSRLADPSTGLATVAIVARDDPGGAARAARSVLAHAPAEVDVVVVGDGLSDARVAEIAPLAAGSERLELIRTSAVLGQGAALNITARRATGELLVIIDPSVELTGEAITPLANVLRDPEVAIAGPFGLRSGDLRHFEEVTTDPAVAIEGYVQAFRRADVVRRGPFDEAFRFYRNLDIWWSLVLRDAGEGQPPRRAAIVDGLPVSRHDHVAWTSTPASERDRLSKRNFYRVLDRFRDRLDLAIPEGPAGPIG